MTKEVKETINEFIIKQFTNRDGVTMDTVIPKDKVFMKQFLIEYYNEFKKLFANEERAEKLFIKRLSRITHIRFDKTNQYEMPLKLAFDDMKETYVNDETIMEKNKILDKYEEKIRNEPLKIKKDKLAKKRDEEIAKLNLKRDKILDKIFSGKYDCKIEGGVCFPAKEHDMVALLIPDFMSLNEDAATHTLIHELTHALTMKDEGDHYRLGVKVDKRNKMQNALNEGFTEEIAQRLWAKMYPSKPCPGVGRYGERVEAVEAILSTFSDDGDVIEDYLVDGRKTVETLKSMVNVNGENLYDYLEQMYSANYNPAERKKIIAKIGDYIYDETAQQTI